MIFSVISIFSGVFGALISQAFCMIYCIGNLKKPRWFIKILSKHYFCFVVDDLATYVFFVYIYIFHCLLTRLFLKSSLLIKLRMQKAQNSELAFVFKVVYSYYWLLSRLYFTYILVGTPPKWYYLDMDTGSDLTWIQCDAPCRSCGKVLLS